MSKCSSILAAPLSNQKPEFVNCSDDFAQSPETVVAFFKWNYHFDWSDKKVQDARSKDKTILENLRPIPLLNVNYKILPKVIAKRIESLASVNEPQSNWLC